MDYKYEIQKIAEEIAYREHDCEFYELSEELKDKIWRRAEVEFAEHLQDYADNLREEMEFQRR